MIKFITENYSILRKAIGEEPLMHIFLNAIRKFLGLSPKTYIKNLDGQEKGNFINSSHNNYEQYLENRATVLEQREGEMDVKQISLALVWVIPPVEDSEMKKIWDSVKRQSFAFDKIYVVANDSFGAKEYIDLPHFSTLNEACFQSQEDYIFILNDIAELGTFFVQVCKEFMAEKPAGDVFYTCDDEIDIKGLRCDPQFKPEFNKYLLYNSNYVGRNIVVRRSLGERLGWFEASFVDAYIYDFILRASEKKVDFLRIEEVLIHRKYSNTEEDIGERIRALQNHLIRIKDFATVVLGLEKGTTRLNRNISGNPVVSIIIPFRDQVSMLKGCVDSILSKTSYKNYEVILANNGSIKAETKMYLDEVQKENQLVSVLNIDIPFNFSQINNQAVESCRGEYILFLNNDTQVINEEWLDNMVAELENEDVGVVGAKLLYADNTVQHAGVILGVGHIAGHPFRNLGDADEGHMSRANSTQEYLAVTGACLLTKRSMFDAVKGFDQDNLKIAYNDVDYCLKVHDAGYKIIYTPYAKLYHFESKSRAYDLSKKEVGRYNKECDFMRAKWKDKYFVDPFFHPHLDNKFEDFRIA